MNNELKIRLALDGQQAVASGLQSVGTQLQGVGTSAGQAVQGSDNLSAALGRVSHYGLAGGGLYALVQSARAVGAALFESSASAQRLATQMNFATDGRGAQELAFVSGVAHDLGLELKTTAQAYAGFASAARGTALQGTGARDVFEAMSKASAVMGLSADQASGALLAVQQMMSKGTVSAEEFRGQLGERMPIALQAGAKALGVTTAEFNKMMESGQIVAEDFLPKFAQAMTEMLGNSAQDAAKRLDAATARMGNAWDKLKKTIGDSGLSQAMANEADGLGEYMTALSDSMDRAKASGAGMVGQLSNGVGYAMARAGFDLVSGAANLLNGTLNAVSGGALGLNTNINLLPDSMRTTAYQAAQLDGKIKEARASFADLQARAQKDPGNIYIKNDMARLSQYIGQLQEAKRQKDALTGGDSSTKEGIRRSGMLRESIEGKWAKDRDSLAALQMKVSGVPDGYVKDMTEIIRLNEAGVLVGKAYTDMLAAQQTALLKKTQATGTGKSAQDDLNKAVERGVKTYGDLIAQESGLNADFAEKWKDLAAAFGKGKLSADQLLQAQQALLALQPAIKKAAEDRIKAENDAFDEAMKRQDADNAATEARIKTGRTMLDQIEFETKLLGLNATEREMATAMRELERQGVVQGTEAWAAYADKVREAIAGREAIKANLEASKAAQSAWEKTADKIESSLTDALMRGFESGKSFAQNLKDTVVNMFKTMVLRPVIQGVVSLGMGAVGLGAPGMASANPAAGYATNMVSNYAQSAALTGLLTSNAAYGAAIGTTNIAAGSQAAMLAAQTSGFGAAGTAATASAAGTGSSMMATAAAAGPYVLAAVAVLNAMGLFRSTKTVGGGIVGTLGTGSVQSYDLQREGGTLFDGPSYSVQGMAATAQTAALENAFVTLRTSTAQMAKDLGLSTDKVNQFTMAVGDVQVHPDIQQLGLVLDGLSEPQKLEAINQLLQKSADGMAQVVLGAGATAQQLAQIYAATMQERKGLELQLLQVQGDTVEIRNRERAALQESNRAIYDQINALQDSKAATEAAAQAEAAIAQQRQGLQDQLDQLLGNTAALRERERNALDASNRSLYDQINALQDSKTAAEQAAQAQQAAIDNAWSLVERSADAERTLVQARIDAAQRQAQTLGSIFAALQSGVDDLYRDTLSVQQQAAVQGRAYITQALSTARRTGYLPDAEGLQSAIAAVRGGMAGKQYTSAFEQERDRLILAGELSQLKDITGEQLSESERMLDVAQQQLKGIDTQVALAKAQIDATQGVNTSVVSLSAALQNLAATQAASRIASNGAAGAAGGASGAMAGLMPAGFISSQGSSGTSLKDLAAALYGSVTTGYDSRKFDTAVNAYGGAQKAFAQLGWDGSRDSAARIAAAYGVTNVPKFAAGGLHSGGLRLVGEMGPELEVTGPARYYDANKTRDMLQGSGTGPDASAEIRSLREELAAQIRALVQSQTRMNRLLERWDGEGMPQERTA